MDTSTNGTVVNGEPVGKNKKIELVAGAKISFSMRPYPHAVFQPIAEASGTSATESDGATASSKRRRSSGGTAVEGATALEADSKRVADATHQKILAKQRAEFAAIQEELAAARRAGEDKDAKLAAAQAAAAEAERLHAAELAKHDEQANEAQLKAQQQAREEMRAHAAALDEATTARHGVEQRLAKAEEEAAAQHTTVAAALEAEKITLGRANAEIAELRQQLDALAEGASTAKREAAAVLEAEQRRTAEHEALCTELRSRLEAERSECAALHAEKNLKADTLRAQENSASEATAQAGEWRRKHDELAARLAAQSEGDASERARLVGELSEARAELRAGHDKLAAATRRAQGAEARCSKLISRAQTSNASLERLAQQSRALDEALQAITSTGHQAILDVSHDEGLDSNADSPMGACGSSQPQGPAFDAMSELSQPLDIAARHVASPDIGGTQLDAVSAVGAAEGVTTPLPPQLLQQQMPPAAGSSQGCSQSSAGGPTQYQPGGVGTAAGGGETPVDDEPPPPTQQDSHAYLPPPPPPLPGSLGGNKRACSSSRSSSLPASQGGSQERSSQSAPGGDESGHQPGAAVSSLGLAGGIQPAPSEPPADPLEEMGQSVPSHRDPHDSAASGLHEPSEGGGEGFPRGEPAVVPAADGTGQPAFPSAHLLPPPPVANPPNPLDEETLIEDDEGADFYADEDDASQRTTDGQENDGQENVDSQRNVDAGNVDAGNETCMYGDDDNDEPMAEPYHGSAYY